MSHSTVEFSSPGTPLADRSVGELVAERPGRSRVFQANNIDFCCQGGRTLKEAGAALRRLRELTDGYQPPAGACNTYRALFAGLAELEEDMHQHIHLENSVLFPAARKLAKGAS